VSCYDLHGRNKTLEKKEQRRKKRERRAFHLLFNLTADNRIMTLFAWEDNGGYESAEARVKM
jgi:hypothetical protein